MESNPYYSAGGFVAAGGSPYGASSQSPGGKVSGQLHKYSGSTRLLDATLTTYLRAYREKADSKR
jgi:hypothetical protein